MDTHQITYVLKHHPSTKSYFRGVYALDEIPRVLKGDKHCCVVNTDPSDQSGSHWLAMYFEGGKGEFFCSYGNPPSFYDERLENFMDTFSNMWNFNSKRLQGTFSTVCGQYCIFYLIKKCEGRTLRNIVSLFGNDLHKNDGKVNDWFNRKYNSSFPTHDIEFTFTQFSRSFEDREVDT